MAILALISWLARLLLRPLDLLAPPVCAACELPGEPVCRACRDALASPPEPLCDRCGHPHEVRVDSCRECPPAVGPARQAVLYTGPAPPIVAALKDGRRRALARVIAQEIAARVSRPPAAAVLVPVPMARRRLRERGFNQSALIAHWLSREWALPAHDVLERVVDGPPQRGASATERRRRVRGAFACRPGRPVPEVAWLVDDVHTTGATLAACARALRRGGARQVGAVAFARAVALGPELARARGAAGEAGAGPSRSERGPRAPPPPDPSAESREPRRLRGTMAVPILTTTRGFVMQLQVKGKNLPVTDALFAHAEKKLGKLARYLPPWDEATQVELELSVERNPSIENRQVAEVTVRTKGPVLRVRESAPDMYMAIDQAAHKLERQAGRYRERRRRRREGREPLPAAVEPAIDSANGRVAADEEPEAEQGPRIVKSKRHEMKPMTPEDAALQMELLGHDFYVFRSAETGALNVVYRRRDGDYGLIAPDD